MYHLIPVCNSIDDIIEFLGNEVGLDCELAVEALDGRKLKCQFFRRDGKYHMFSMNYETKNDRP